MTYFLSGNFGNSIVPYLSNGNRPPQAKEISDFTGLVKLYYSFFVWAAFRGILELRDYNF